MSLIDRFEKAALYLTGALIAVFVFSLIYARTRLNQEVSECVPFNKAYLEPGIHRIDSNTYQIYAVASMWRFEPSEIRIPRGSEVDIFLSSKDVVHGFNIARKNVNLMAVYGSINKTTIRFDEPGKYEVVCHEYCGIAHQNMHTIITVQP